MYTHGPHRVSPRKELSCGSFFKKHNFDKSDCLTYYVASSLVCSSSLVVITIVGLLDVLMVSNSAELRSFLLTICILGPESTTNYLSSGSFVDAAGRTHSSAGKLNAACLFFFELVNVFGKSPRVHAGASLLSFSLFMGPVLKFRSIGTSLMRNFDIFFFQAMVLSFPGYLHDVA